LGCGVVDGLEEDWVLGAGAKSFQELLVGRVAERSDDANGNEEELGFGRRIGDIPSQAVTTGLLFFSCAVSWIVFGQWTIPRSPTTVL
jgi:hypothetical protein